jgi:hypothetical protein
MYDNGVITRDEVTKSLREEEKRMQEEQKRLEEEEEKRRKKAPTAGPSGGSGSGIGAGGSGGSSSSGGGSGSDGGGGSGAMASIWTRIFSLPGGREGDEGSQFQISDPSNFRKVDVPPVDDSTGPETSSGLSTTISVAVDSKSPVPAAASATITPPGAGKRPASGGEAAFHSGGAATQAEGTKPGLTRGISVGSGGWVKKSGNAMQPRALASALASQSSASFSAPAAAQPAPSAHPYTASSVPSNGPPSPPEEYGSGEMEPLATAGEQPAAGCEREEGPSSSKILCEGILFWFYLLCILWDLWGSAWDGCHDREQEGW